MANKKYVITWRSKIIHCPVKAERECENCHAYGHVDAKRKG